MALWGNADTAANSPLSTPGGFGKAPTRANANVMYGNTTADASVTGQIVGVYGVDAAEVGSANGTLRTVTVVSGGSGYVANTTVTLSGNATANAQANSTGRIGAVNITAAGSGYTTNPTVTIAAPSAIAFNANTAVDTTLDFISIATNVLQNGDKVRYLVATGNTVLAGLANNTQYFVVGANTTGVKLSSSLGGAAIDLTAKGLTETGHTLTGETATAVTSISGGRKGIAHAGWNLRREGTGGRAGRVTYETLVTAHITGDGDSTFLANT